MRFVTVEQLPLRTAESVDLAHAWVQALADSAAIRVLFVKGPALHRLALRAKRSSSDVDLLVAPQDFEDVCTLLLDAGLAERETSPLARYDMHSRTFIGDDWPCDIDAHAYYPGFLADPDVVFEALWKRRIALRFAGRQCNVPSRASSALMLILHSLRSTAAKPHHDAELRGLFAAAFTPAERREMGAIAAETGCAESIREQLTQLGVDVPVADSAAIDSDALREWQTSVDSRDMPGFLWLRLFLDTPLREKPALLRQALWPSSRDLERFRPPSSDDGKARVTTRLERLRDGLRSLPRAVRLLRRTRHSSDS